MVVRFICFLIIFNTLGLGISNIFIKKNIEKVINLNDIGDDSENNEIDNTSDELEKNLFSNQIFTQQNFANSPYKLVKSFPELPLIEASKYNNIVIPPPKIS